MCVLLFLAANFDWSLKQFDAKNFFLHGDLEEELHMDMPPGYGMSNNSGKVCRLRKALYGLKSSRAWLGRFTDAMEKYGYHQVTEVEFDILGGHKLKTMGYFVQSILYSSYSQRGEKIVGDAQAISGL
ncbi:hypothetical protein L3X38_025048 [Prunus dulcis]|uniref:Reverse transcriptase Ty1/copia-type domain-containing protein n=1 Tax=Prunus dulcis TaxID=3755 RepID=A0AAD4Z6Q5_PRUDU|nr:hypothetical protein L3X38_025048 [Prunus dulcis]